MSNGHIYANSAVQRGGGVCLDGATTTFTMTGGMISDNEIINTMVYVSAGGGVQVHDGASFHMSETDSQIPTIICNNKISAENRGGGGVDVRHLNSSFVMNGGTIQNNEVLGAQGFGGGVHITHDATFEMYAGIIKENTAGDRGGGITVSMSSTADLEGGTIEGNTAAQSGGGIYVGHNSVVTMSGSTLIYDNEAEEGGGVIIRTGAAFNMNGGYIKGNRATNGGGVWVRHDGTFTATSGAITGNTATNYGGGIWTQRYQNLNISNAVIFNPNAANALFDYGIANRGIAGNVDPANSGGGDGGNKLRKRKA